LSCESISVTVVREPAPHCILLLYTFLFLSIWFAGEIFSMHVHNTSSRPSLFLSARPEFFERGEVFKQKIPRGGPSKKTCQRIFHQITTPSRSPHLDHDQDRALRFRYIWSMMTRSIHECWHVRTNECVRTNICKKSVFVVSIRHINICGKILTQFTGLLRTNTVAAKRDLLAERTGFGKSVLVSLRKNGPKTTTNPPAPMNHVKMLRAGPAEMPFQNWYTANTKHFLVTDSASLKSKIQLGWGINPVPHNIVRRIRFWRIKISGTWFYIFVLENK